MLLLVKDKIDREDLDINPDHKDVKDKLTEEEITKIYKEKSIYWICQSNSLGRCGIRSDWTVYL